MKKVDVLYNACYGGYSLSENAKLELIKRHGNEVEEIFESRHDSKIVDLYKEMGSEWMSGDCAKIEIVSIEADGYKIDDYDGKESVIECYVDFILI